MDNVYKIGVAFRLDEYPDIQERLAKATVANTGHTNLSEYLRQLILEAIGYQTGVTRRRRRNVKSNAT